MAKKKTVKKAAVKKKAMRVSMPDLPQETEAVVELGNAINLHGMELEGIRCRIDRLVTAIDKSKSVRGI